LKVDKGWTYLSMCGLCDGQMMDKMKIFEPWEFGYWVLGIGQNKK